MKTILELEDGRRWEMLENLEDAKRAEELSQTAVAHYYAWDGQAGLMVNYYLLKSIGGEAADVVLRGPNEALSANAECSEVARGLVLVTGFRNADPYPAHGQAIAALSEAIGVPLPPESYPYGRDPGEDPGRDEPIEDLKP